MRFFCLVFQVEEIIKAQTVTEVTQLKGQFRLKCSNMKLKSKKIIFSQFCLYYHHHWTIAGKHLTVAAETYFETDHLFA